jgi:hypothetical protein
MLAATLLLMQVSTTRRAKVDLSSPDAALDSLIDAVEQGDLDAYERVVLRQTDEERRAALAEIEVNLAVLRLIDATRRKLGGDAAARVQEMTGRVGLGPSKDAADNLRDARRESKWRTDGNDAVLGEVIPEIRFRRVESGWRLIRPLDETGQDLNRHLALVKQYVQMMDDVTRRVVAGDLTTADQIGRALNFVWPVATTEPATRPTTDRP